MNLKFFFDLFQVVEHCCSITSLQLGETLPSVSKDMDTMTFRVPLGVCAGITPFNFPVCFFFIIFWEFSEEISLLEGHDPVVDVPVGAGLR
jgi:hypothetical protein